MFVVRNYYMKFVDELIINFRVSKDVYLVVEIMEVMVCIEFSFFCDWNVFVLFKDILFFDFCESGFK